MGVTLAFALGLLGLIRASELRAEDRAFAAGAWGTVGVAGLFVGIGGALFLLLAIATDGPLL